MIDIGSMKRLFFDDYPIESPTHDKQVRNSDGSEYSNALPTKEDQPTSPAFQDLRDKTPPGATRRCA